MPKYNIFKIRKSSESALVARLTSEKVGLEQIFEKKIHDFNVKFLFSTNPDKADIWWLAQYGDFFEEIELPKNLIYFASVVISNENCCYAVSLGKCHFFLREFCEFDFGLRMAERIADLKKPRSKNSQHFQSKRSKTITSYKQGYDLDYDSGESLNFLRAETISIKKWGRVASFGHSLQLSVSESPNELVKIIKRIEKKLSLPAKEAIPKTELVKDPNLIQKLDESLVAEINGYGESTALQIDEFSMSGVDFVFNDQHQYSIYLKGKFRERTEASELAIENLNSFLADNNISLIDSIDEIFVQVLPENSKPWSHPLKCFLDFVDSEESCALINGQWHHFNPEYLTLLNKDVNRIPIEYESQFDTEKSINEDSFNKKLAESHGYFNFDKDLESLPGGHTLEKMDLYKSNSLYFVKIGAPQKLGYVIDQAMNTVKLLQNREIKIEIQGKRKKIKNIVLWIIVPRKSQIEKLSEFRSLIFKMKLVEWRRTVLLSGMVPIVKVNYKKKKSP